jgi:hypothetical protein
LELAEAARGAWVVLLGIVDTESDGSDQGADPARVTHVLDSPDRAPAFKRKIEAMLTDPHTRDALRESLEHTLDVSRELISRWGAILTGSSSFSGLFDRHVEMIGRIHGLWHFLAHGTRRGNRFRSPGGIHRDDWFIDNLLSMTRIAIRLEEETWAIALEVVPPDWWDKRTDELAAPAHTATRDSEGVARSPPTRSAHSGPHPRTGSTRPAIRSAIQMILFTDDPSAPLRYARRDPRARSHPTALAGLLEAGQAHDR